MIELLKGMLAFAALFALLGVYALLRPRSACSGTCGTCGSAAGCELAGAERPERPE